MEAFVNGNESLNCIPYAPVSMVAFAATIPSTARFLNVFRRLAVQSTARRLPDVHV